MVNRHLPLPSHMRKAATARGSKCISHIASSFIHRIKASYKSQNTLSLDDKVIAIGGELSKPPVKAA